MEYAFTYCVNNAVLRLIKQSALRKFRESCADTENTQPLK